MDKLRALQYFVTAAREGSFTKAAGRLDVTVPAIAKLINALEQGLGAKLFSRTRRGLALTTEGEGYLEACNPLLDQLAQADDAVRGAALRPRGTLVIGAPSFIAQHCLLPALPRFLASYPDIVIDIRVVNRPTDAAAAATDVLVLAGWSEPGEFVRRRLAQTRLLICATPAYWAAHGVPAQPRDLEKHPCMLFRNASGTVLDLWNFERNGEVESVVMSSWLVSDHRDLILDAALAGEGIARMTDLSIRQQIRGGRLAPVLMDWECRDAPIVDLLYRPNHRRTPRVRLFVDFVSALFKELESERDDRFAPRHSTERPTWHRHHPRRASASLAARPK